MKPVLFSVFSFVLFYFVASGWFGRTNVHTLNILSFEKINLNEFFCMCLSSDEAGGWETVQRGGKTKSRNHNNKSHNNGSVSGSVKCKRSEKHQHKRTMHYNNESNNEPLNGPKKTVTTKGPPENKGLDPNFVGGSVNASNTMLCINDKKLHTNSSDSCNNYRSHNQEILTSLAAERASNKIPLREVYDSKSPERHYFEREENLVNRCYHSPDHGGGGGRRKRESAVIIRDRADSKESEKENIPLTDDEDADGDDEAEDDLSLDIYELDDSLKDEELERSIYAESEELRSISSRKSPLSDDDKVHFDDEEKEAFAVSLLFNDFW